MRPAVPGRGAGAGVVGVGLGLLLFVPLVALCVVAVAWLGVVVFAVLGGVLLAAG